MNNVLHLDRGGKASLIETTTDGFLRVKGTIAQVGWLKYINRDGTIRKEYVSEEALFDENHLKSIGNAPITLLHPKGIITPQTYKKDTVGSTGSHVFARKDLGTVEIITMIGDQAAITSVLDGVTTDLSEGYRCSTSHRKGNEFDQLNRDCNHNALVPEGRADKARLHIDSSEDCLFGEYITDTIDLPVVKFYLSSINLQYKRNNNKVNIVW